jgi:predicted acetyltransferase
MSADLEIVQLGESDFEETVDFLDLAFGFVPPGRNFRTLLPKLYRPDRMKSNYALRGKNGIRAVVGVIPMTLLVGDTALPLAGIGGVSTHPDDRGQGHMRRLMTHAVAEIRRGGFALSYLGGQRQRYRHFGYEKCGTGNTFVFNPRNFKAPPAGDETLHFVTAQELSQEDVREIRILHDAQPIHVARAADEFVEICESWYNQLVAARDESGHLAGYIIANADGTEIFECVLRSPGYSLAVILRWLKERKSESVTIQVPSMDLNLIRAMAAEAEETRLSGSGQWQVFDWPAVTEALLKVRRHDPALQDGAVRLGIQGAGVLNLTVDGKRSGCSTTDEAPDLTCSQAEALRLLFGPLSPAAVKPLGEHAPCLDSWCPLPLFMRSPDAV